MTSPLVSVVIPVYNTGSSAKTLVDSLLICSYSNLEIILVDDGSADDSLSTLKAIKSTKVKVFSKKNGGASSARNFGLKKSTGKYLVFIDSDDSVDKFFIEKLVREIERPDTALAATAVRYKKLDVASSEDVYLDPFPKKPQEKMEAYVVRSLLHDGRMYPAFNKIFHADIIRENQLVYDESWDFAEDTKFVLDYLKVAKGNIRFILEPLYVYNSGTATSSVKKTGIIWANWQKSFDNLKKWVGPHPTAIERTLLTLLHAKWRVSCIRSAYHVKKQRDNNG